MRPDETSTNQGLRWPRLFAVFLWNFAFFSLGSLLGEFSWDFSKNGIATVTIHLVLVWFGRALAFGLFCGLFIAFSTWLAQEIFGNRAAKNN